MFFEDLSGFQDLIARQSLMFCIFFADLAFCCHMLLSFYSLGYIAC